MSILPSLQKYIPGAPFPFSISSAGVLSNGETNRTKSLVLLATAGIICVPIVVRWLYLDYKEWMSLSPGFLDKTLKNYIKTLILRPLKRNTITTLVYKKEGESYLGAIPPREGPRPKVNGQVVPQRQLDQLAPALEERIYELVESIAVAHPDVLIKKPSLLEKVDYGYFIRPEVVRPHPEVSRMLKDEILHIHPGNCTLHMSFSHLDACKIVESGWGERHGLSGSTLFDIPIVYTLIYAPRDEYELDMLRKFMLASVSYMTGKNVSLLE